MKRPPLPLYSWEARGRECLLLAHSGHPKLHRTCPLSGGKADIGRARQNVSLLNTREFDILLCAIPARRIGATRSTKTVRVRRATRRCGLVVRWPNHDWEERQ